MAVRAPEQDLEPELAPAPSGPALAEALALGACLALLLVANGRPLGAGDTRANERVAASLVGEGDLDLDEYPEVEEPFAREVGGRRVSIYPVLSSVLAAPVFALAGRLFALDETGSALAGKAAAALFSALAAGLMFTAVGLRRPRDEAAWTALVFALGTTVWSTSQALWQHPAAVLFLCAALLCMVRAEHEAAWAGRAGLPLALAVAARHADAALVAALALGVAARWPRRIPHLVLWALPPLALVLVYNAVYFGSPLQHGFSDAMGRFSAPWGEGHLGLLVSPGKGLLVFTPVAVVAAAGLLRAFRRGERWLAGTLALAFLAHLAVMGRWSEWHGGRSWGPRLLTDALPLLFLFLPEGLDLLPRLGPALAGLSVAVQAMGAFAYDYRWERLHQPAGSDPRAALWDVARSPLAFHARRRVVTVALPAVRERRAMVREHPLVVLGPEGSRVRFAGEGPVLSGGDPTLQDVHLERGARVEGGRLRLRGRWDALFLRVRPPARQRRLELRLRGRGRGVLYVGERSFWSHPPRWTTYTMAGAFSLRHPYHFPRSGGADLLVTIGLGGGQADLDSVALVPPGDPEAALELGAAR